MGSITSFLVEHNLPFEIAGHLKNLVQPACPDSKIAAELRLKKSKARAIVSNVTGKVAGNELVKCLKENKCSLIVDESTEKSKTKHLAQLVRTAVKFLNHLRLSVHSTELGAGAK